MDLKPGNILLHDPSIDGNDRPIEGVAKATIAKIADFGLSKIYQRYGDIFTNRDPELSQGWFVKLFVTN